MSNVEDQTDLGSLSQEYMTLWTNNLGISSEQFRDKSHFDLRTI